MRITRFKRLYNLIFAAISLSTAAEVWQVVPHCQSNQVGVWIAARVHHTHSKETLTKWAEWRREHPNWKPKTTSETLAAFDWACLDVSTNDQTVALDTTEFTNTIPVLEAEPQAEDTPSTQSEAKATLTTEGRTTTANVVTGTNNTFYPAQFSGWGFAGAPVGLSGTLPPIHNHPGHPKEPCTPPVPEPSCLGLVLLGTAGFIKLYNRKKDETVK